jgi:hypothetical protein
MRPLSILTPCNTVYPEREHLSARSSTRMLQSEESTPRGRETSDAQVQAEPSP